MSELTHLDASGNAHMVDVGAKEVTERSATAEAFVRLGANAFAALAAGNLKKGDALGVARVAGIMAAKRTGDLVPLCHPLPITGVTVTFDLLEETHAVRIEATVKVVARTGVEMEALTAASVAALTIYDMCKAVEKAITIEGIRLLAKSGGRSGDFRADADTA
ncbi:MAG: cyclic pyranopterin monophosphate synthase MoaC [Bacteroidetes bacterium]|nr:cyclic pyranopterin monophosphate synthase MoaC [Bacteroidota bacterium]